LNADTANGEGITHVVFRGKMQLPDWIVKSFANRWPNWMYRWKSYRFYFWKSGRKPILPLWSIFVFPKV